MIFIKWDRGREARACLSWEWPVSFLVGPSWLFLLLRWGLFHDTQDHIASWHWDGDWTDWHQDWCKLNKYILKLQRGLKNPFDMCYCYFPSKSVMPVDIKRRYMLNGETDQISSRFYYYNWILNSKLGKSLVVIIPRLSKIYSCLICCTFCKSNHDVLVFFLQL